MYIFYRLCNMEVKPKSDRGIILCVLAYQEYSCYEAAAPCAPDTWAYRLVCQIRPQLSGLYLMGGLALKQWLLIFYLCGFVTCSNSVHKTIYQTAIIIVLYSFCMYIDVKLCVFFEYQKCINMPCPQYCMLLCFYFDNCMGLFWYFRVSENTLFMFMLFFSPWKAMCIISKLVSICTQCNPAYPPINVYSHSDIKICMIDVHMVLNSY